MEFKFTIDKKLILGGILFNDKRKAQYVDVRNDLWEKYQDAYNQALIYKNWIEDAWNKSKEKIEKALQSILKIDLPRETFEVILVPYVIGGGIYLGNNKIFWGDHYGDKERFPNYNVVYLVHESLHSMFSRSDLDHALIELISDNELRVRLNGGGEYFKCNGIETGHDFLLNLEKGILNDWKKYLVDPDIDIFQFRKTLKSKNKIKA